MWLDLLAIPRDSPHPENALRLIDYLLRPEVVAAVTNTVGYANANALAADFVDEELRSDPAIYPSAAMRRRLFLDEPAQADYEKERAALWQAFKK